MIDIVILSCPYVYVYKGENKKITRKESDKMNIAYLEKTLQEWVPFFIHESQEGELYHLIQKYQFPYLIRLAMFNCQQNYPELPFEKYRTLVVVTDYEEVLCSPGAIGLINYFGYLRGHHSQNRNFNFVLVGRDSKLITPGRIAGVDNPLFRLLRFF